MLRNDSILDETELRVKKFATNVLYDKEYGKKNILTYSFALEQPTLRKEWSVNVNDFACTILNGDSVKHMNFTCYEKCFEEVKKLVLQKLKGGYDWAPGDINNRG